MKRKEVNNELTQNEFLDEIKGKKIDRCYLANTKEEKQNPSGGVSIHGLKCLHNSELVDLSNSRYVDINFDYGSQYLVFELGDKTKIIISGSEWNLIRVIK